MLPCCTGGDPAARDESLPAPRGRARSLRVRGVFGWGLPIAALVLIPKCPACVAGYVLLLTGVGLSYSSATALRRALVGACLAALACLAVRAVRRAIPRLRSEPSGASPGPR